MSPKKRKRMIKEKYFHSTKNLTDFEREINCVDEDLDQETEWRFSG